MNNEKYKYTYQYDWMGTLSEEECYITKDSFYPYGVVKEGLKTRGEFGFMEIIKVFGEPNARYGKFIAKAISYEDMNRS